jgi:HSP20 family protein
MIPVRRKFPGTFSRLENELEPFWDPFDRFLKQENWEMVPQRVFPTVNVAETDDMFEVTAELPGINANDVKVEIQNGILWISGEKKEMKEEKGRTFHRIESTFGEFNRRIDLPGVVKENEIVAEFENGVLKIAIPKSEELKPKQIKVKAH